MRMTTWRAHLQGSTAPKGLMPATSAWRSHIAHAHTHTHKRPQLFLWKKWGATQDGLQHDDPKAERRKLAVCCAPVRTASCLGPQAWRSVARLTLLTLSLGQSAYLLKASGSEDNHFPTTLSCREDLNKSSEMLKAGRGIYLQ